MQIREEGVAVAYTLAALLVLVVALALVCLPSLVVVLALLDQRALEQPPRWSAWGAAVAPYLDFGRTGFTLAFAGIYLARRENP